MLDIYKASAGAGKTFALTLEYFRIIFESPAEYKNILAVTFTNKATEEMKSRIINELHKLADGQKSDYGTILKEEFNITDEQLKNRATLLRTMLLHDYGRMSVTTIDRFFQRILKSFTHELGIFPGYNVELDSDYVLLKAVDKIMQQLKAKPELKVWISELMTSSVDEGKSWSVKSKIAELGEELFKENYMLFDRHVLEKFSDKQFLKNYKEFLNHIISSFEQRLSAIGRLALQIIGEEELVLSDFKSGKNGCASYFYKLASGHFEEPNATTCKAIDTPENWFTAKSPVKTKIESVYPRLNRLLKEAVQFVESEFHRYNSAKHLSGNLYQLGILNDLYAEVRGFCDEKGLMLLSDTTHILNMLIDGNDTSFLFEKSGNYYKHVMIDEFQDTSSMQWKNFRPLVVNSLSEGYHAMIVGDVKQSIYRWRNGDWGLLAKGVEEQFRHFGVNNIVLCNNWRSAQEIVDFNNHFFEMAAVKLARLYQSEAGEEDQRCQAILDAYRALRQQPKKQKNGYVEVVFGPEKKEEQCDQQIMEEVIAILKDIRQRGGLLKDIVILVRSGKEGAFVADCLMQYNQRTGQSIPFISNDSLYIWSSAYVQFIVAILQYITEPYDMINKATILYFYRIFVQDQSNSCLHELFMTVQEEDLFQYLDTGFSADAGSVLSYSLYETIEAIIEHFSLKEKREEVPYLIAFQDTIYEYEMMNSNSIVLFLEWWEKEKTKKVLSTSEEVNAVRILTIHKSKGLEFDYVILPFCSWELDNVRPVRRIWCRNCQEGFNILEYAPLNYSSKLSATLFREDYLDEHMRAYIDNLNLLYVALTRAKTELYIRPYAPKLNKDGSVSLSDMGAFIYEVFSGENSAWESSFQFSDQWNLFYGKKQKLNGICRVDETPLSLPVYPVFQLKDRISVKYNFRDYTEPERTELSAIDEGKLLHEIFKSIRYAEDVEFAVQHAWLSGLIQNREVASYIQKIQVYLQQPEVSEWFSPRNEIINERDILFPSGSKSRPDRVVICNQVVRIIDYKFGQREENKYLKQVRYYCMALNKMGYNRVEGYIWYVKAGKIVRV